MYEIVTTFATLILELSVLFVGISFLINLVQIWIPYDKVNMWLSGKNSFVGALGAIVFAFVTPFCSCSTIPIVVNLLNKKVRFGIVMIFLFSSPILDPTILTLMVFALGWKVATFYTLITSVLSIVIGFALEKMGFENAVKEVAVQNIDATTATFSVATAWKETIDLMKAVYPYLLFGAGIGAFIHEVVPTEWISTYLGGDSWWLIPLAAIVGIPLYVRLSAMIPVSQILIAKGMSAGAVMALVISSAGASMPEIVMLNSIFQKRLVVAFIGSVILMSTVSGFLFYLL
ncbi:permease [Sporomusa sp.]|uniref:permease n=1 Tax=Sporomusa sp. TaxID=2078658 RepID=UPI002CA883B1|nr:permease [Sporomusa sp.]HWR09778.1 permease [Sporomusa sp.]